MAPGHRDENVNMDLTDQQYWFAALNIRILTQDRGTDKLECRVGSPENSEYNAVSAKFGDQENQKRHNDAIAEGTDKIHRQNRQDRNLIRHDNREHTPASRPGKHGRLLAWPSPRVDSCRRLIFELLEIACWQLLIAMKVTLYQNDLFDKLPRQSYGTE